MQPRSFGLEPVSYTHLDVYKRQREYRALIDAVDAGDLPTARALHRRLIPVVNAIMRTSQGAIMAKAALVELGVIEHATVRLPLVESTPEELEILREGLRLSQIGAPVHA